MPSLLSPSRFRFLNETHELQSATDWNNLDWEKLWLYHLHYFDDLNAEGAARRADWHAALIGRWVAENPPGRGNGWEPYPLSRRIVNWIEWAWVGNDLPPGGLASLVMQARYLRKRLEWHILGNHLLANAKALIFAGLFFEGLEAECRLATGASIFSRQLTEQVLADGGHFERSPMYHTKVLEDILDVVNAVRMFPDRIEDSNAVSLFALREQCGDAARRMLGWLAVMIHPDGGIVLLNDSAFGGAADAAALEAYAARLGIRRDGRLDSAASGGSFLIQALRDTGHIRVDSGDMVAFLDTAPIGPDYLPGHAHADTLGFELSLGRLRVIVDSGVSRYGDGPERLRLRGTAAHNTVQIDGQDSSEVWGGFRVARRAYPRDLQIRAEDGLRSFDRSMPEEINRLLTDAISDMLFCSEPSGVENLKREGVAEEKIFFVGNVMIDTLLKNREKAENSPILEQLGVNGRPCAVVTLHRPSNVDDPAMLGRIMGVLEEIDREMPVIFPVHPRTRATDGVCNRWGQVFKFSVSCAW